MKYWLGKLGNYRSSSPHHPTISRGQTRSQKTRPQIDGQDHSKESENLLSSRQKTTLTLYLHLSESDLILRLLENIPHGTNPGEGIMPVSSLGTTISYSKATITSRENGPRSPTTSCRSSSLTRKGVVVEFFIIFA